MQRTELADKTLAANALVDRRLKIKISEIDIERSLAQKSLNRERQKIHRELKGARRMSLQTSSMSSLSSSSSPRLLRRLSSPSDTSIDEMPRDNMNAVKRKVSSSSNTLELPSRTSLRRRSLPSPQSIVSLPPISNTSIVGCHDGGSRRRSFSDKARPSTLDLNPNSYRFENVSPFPSPSLSPRHSISSLVSSLSNSTSRLQIMQDSEDTFDRVKQFLLKLDVGQDEGEVIEDKNCDEKQQDNYETFSQSSNWSSRYDKHS